MPVEKSREQILLTVREVAHNLGVSESWVRRHDAELPLIRIGRLVRFDSILLAEKFQGTIQNGNSLKPERQKMTNRYQRGCVVQRGKKGQKVWYGKFREDVQKSARMERKQRLVRLGTITELPTKNAARSKLAKMMSEPTPPVAASITFEELVKRWQEAEGPTMKNTTMQHYKNALRASVLPHFGTREITSINREDIQKFLGEKAKSYSTSTLRSMRVVLGLTLGWAEACDLIHKNPCSKIKLPRQTGGRTVRRTFLTAEDVNRLASKLQELYATLVLFLYATGLRIGEAVAVKWSDIDSGNLTVSRRIYDGKIDTVKSARSQRKLPIEPMLLERLRVLGEGHDWLFRSESGTPINPGNALKRYVRPAAVECGIALGGWHDFRHTLSTTLRRKNVHPKVVADILGHSRVNLAMDVYDRTDVQDFVEPLAAVASELVSSGIKSAAAA